MRLALAEAIESPSHTPVKGDLIVLGLLADRKQNEDIPYATVDATPQAPTGTWPELAQMTTHPTHDFARVRESQIWPKGCEFVGRIVNGSLVR